MAAPGSGVFSTFPAAITAERPLCADQGFSDCGGDDYRNPEGTSFAAPQVSAAAAVLLAVAPSLTNNQVAAVLEHSTDDVNAATGCPRCGLLRDPLSGWGRLNVAKAIAALAGPLPSPDRYRDERRRRHPGAHDLGKKTKITATVDYYDDQIDVYRVALSGRERITANVAAGWPGAQLSLMLWKPGTNRIDETKAKTLRVAQSAMPGAKQKVTFTARGRGWYYVEVKVSSPGFGPYALTLSKTTSP